MIHHDSPEAQEAAHAGQLVLRTDERAALAVSIRPIVEAIAHVSAASKTLRAAVLAGDEVKRDAIEAARSRLSSALAALDQ